MNENTIQITIDDYFKTVVGIIAHDLVINKHLYNLRQSGLDTSVLYLHLQKHIFTLIGLNPFSITDELVEWYNKQAEEANNIDCNDQDKLYSLSTRIMLGLMEVRMNEAI